MVVWNMMMMRMDVAVPLVALAVLLTSCATFFARIVHSWFQSDDSPWFFFFEILITF
jgi:hypothetical protein